MKNQNQQPTPISHEQTEAKAEVIKLGIDVHQSRHVVVAQFSPEEFDAWAKEKQKGKAKGVISLPLW